MFQTMMTRPIPQSGADVGGFRIKKKQVDQADRGEGKKGQAEEVVEVDKAPSNRPQKI